jgi:Spy/CpxP family protein refolding chaperone
MRSTWKATLLLAATFTGGALVGGAVTGLADRDRSGGKYHHHHHGTDDHIQFLSKQLELTPAQKDSVQAILTRYKASMDSIWRQVGPRFETIKDSISNAIRRQLTPEQQQEYTDMMRRFDEERRSPSDK